MPSVVTPPRRKGSGEIASSCSVVTSPLMRKRKESGELRRLSHKENAAPMKRKASGEIGQRKKSGEMRQKLQKNTEKAAYPGELVPTVRRQLRPSL